MSKTAQLIQKASVHAQRKEFAEAVKIYRKVLSKEPNNLDANYLLGSIYCELGELESAHSLLVKAYELRPNSPYVCNNLGNLYKMRGLLDDAVRFYQQAIALKWDIPQAHFNLGSIFQIQGRHDEAISCFENVKKIAPGMVAADASLASVLENRGDYSGALAILEPIIRSGRADYQTLVTYGVTLLHAEASGEELHHAGNLLDRFLDQYADRMSPRDAGHGWLTLGQIYDAVADYEAAFACFVKGNRRLALPFDEQRYFARLDSLRSAYAADHLKDLPVVSGVGADLIFIVGMPRSGSTLIEQILNSHPAVGSLGESQYFAKARAAVCKLGDRALSQPELATVGAGYRQQIPDDRRNARFLTDKSLENFLELGNIAQVFPEARVINCCRNVLDTCVSCYTYKFTGFMPFTNDLHALGRYCRGYLDIMDFWGNSLDLAILNFDYETLVADMESGVRRLLDFCGLPWDDACLAFHKNTRFANTASYHQVRKPIYSSAVGRYKNYEQYLGPFKEGLGQAT